MLQFSFFFLFWLVIFITTAHGVVDDDVDVLLCIVRSPLGPIGVHVVLLCVEDEDYRLDQDI